MYGTAVSQHVVSRERESRALLGLSLSTAAICPFVIAFGRSLSNSPSGYGFDISFSHVATERDGSTRFLWLHLCDIGKCVANYFCVYITHLVDAIIGTMIDARVCLWEREKKLYYTSDELMKVEAELYVTREITFGLKFSRRTFDDSVYERSRVA